jgi:hypothetical protein
VGDQGRAGEIQDLAAEGGSDQEGKIREAVPRNEAGLVKVDGKTGGAREVIVRCIVLGLIYP